MGLLSVAFDARSGSVYDEGASGDLSNSGLTPTALEFSSGSNLVIGMTGRSETTDRDYFTFTIAPGQTFVALLELAGTTVVNDLSFIGIQAGAQVTVPTDAADATGLLGWTHFAATSADIDILPAIGTGGAGSTGFLPPLPAGMYAVWLQDTGFGSSSYRLDFQVTPVPEPGSATGILVGLISLVALRRRAKRS